MPRIEQFKGAHLNYFWQAFSSQPFDRAIEAIGIELLQNRPFCDFAETQVSFDSGHIVIEVPLKPSVTVVSNPSPARPTVETIGMIWSDRLQYN